jgi:hypothetical protein
MNGAKNVYPKVTYCHCFSLGFASLVVQLNYEFQQSYVPNEWVQGIHGVVASTFLQATKGSSIVYFFQ